MNPTTKAGLSFPGNLEEMTTQEVKAFRPEVVVLPLGSTEPHGQHLPLGTDTFQVRKTCELGVKLANSRGARALLYPTLPITTNANMRKVPFALRIGVRTLMSVLADISKQCWEDGIRKVVIFNGHGGNSSVIEAALREISAMDDMPFVCTTGGKPPDGFVNPIQHPSDHAGESETSRMMYCRPDLVKKEKFAKYPFGELCSPALKGIHFVRPWHLYLPETAGGETRESTEEKGRILTEGNAEGLANLLVELTRIPWSKNFPYLSRRDSTDISS